MKPRHPKSFAMAMTKMRTQLGEATCAEIVDRSTSLVRKWADPDHPSAPNLEQAVLLDRAYVEAGYGKPPLLELYGELLASALASVDGKREPADMLLSALTVQGVVGDLSEAIREALSAEGAGGRAITPRERSDILQILDRLDHEVDQIEDAVEDTGESRTHD